MLNRSLQGLLCRIGLHQWQHVARLKDAHFKPFFGFPWRAPRALDTHNSVIYATACRACLKINRQRTNSDLALAELMGQFWLNDSSWL